MGFAQGEVNPEIHTTCISLERPLSEDRSFLFCLFWKLQFFFFFACHFHFLMKFYRNPSPAIKTPGESRVLSLSIDRQDCHNTWKKSFCSADLPEWKAAVPNRWIKASCKHMVQDRPLSRSPEPWLGVNSWEGIKLSLLVPGDPPQTRQLSAARTACSVSAWPEDGGRTSDLTCDWYPASAKNVPSWEGHDIICAILHQHSGLLCQEE